MKSITLYRAQNTIMHQHVDAFTKLIYLFCSLIAAFFIPNFVGQSVLIAVSLALLAIAKELLRALKTLLGSLVLLLTIFVIQGLFYPGNHTVLFSIGRLHVYQEGVSYALTITLRVVGIIAASSVLIMTTSPADVLEECEKRGLSPKIGYVMTSILQVIPTMMNRAATIREAQQSRGMAVDGNIFGRLRAFLPLFAPIVLSSLMTIQDKAMALDARGFSANSKKTYFHEPSAAHSSMVWIRWFMALTTLAIILWGVLV